MQKLYIAPTRTTFEVTCDPKQNLIEFKGKSYPSNALEFFKPLLDWVEKFLLQTNDGNILISFSVSYFNTSTSKYLFEILEHLNNYHREFGTVKILWHQLEDEDDILETWKELAMELDIPYEIVTEDSGN